MSRWPFQSHRLNRLPRGLVGMLVLVALMEVFLDGQMPNLMSEVAHSWWWTNWSASRPEAVGSEILVLGDSLVKHGVAPRVVESQTGRSVWNLAVLGGRSAHAYYLLRHALASGARPKAIVLDSELLSWEPLEHPELWPQVVTPGEAAELAWAGRDTNFLTRYSLAWLLPSVRCRWELRNEVMAYWRGTSIGLRDHAGIKNRNFRANRGASIFPATQKLDPSSVVTVDTFPAGKTVDGQWEARALNVVYLDRLLALAAERKVPVFWLLPPRYNMLARIFEHPRWNGIQRQFVRERLDRYPNLTVIDGLGSEYGRDVVIDVAHVNRIGAVALSLALGQILRNHLGAPPTATAGPTRWVELPRYTDPPVEALVEDIMQSASIYSAQRAAETAAVQSSTTRR